MKQKLVLMFFICSVKFSYSQSDIFDYDSLGKYSYLLITAKYQPPLENKKLDLSNFLFGGNATCYFYRKDSSTYLCTAYHVLTFCDVFNAKKLDDVNDYFIVRCYDSTNKPVYVIIPIQIALFKTAPCDSFLKRRDFITVDVTQSFKGIKINYINSFCNQAKKGMAFSFIAYGYPGVKWSGFRSYDEYENKIKPTQYFGKIDTVKNDAFLKDSRFESMYYLTRPAIYQGFSGAPVFVEKAFKKKKWIEFVGTVSGSDFVDDNTIITNCIRIVNDFNNMKTN